MQNAYQLQSPVVQRESQSFGLATQASMIDPNLSSQQLMSQMSQAFAQTQHQSRNGMAITNAQNSQSDSIGRTLPSTDVTNDILDDAYIRFILYCNPSLRNDIDTSDLKKAFRTPPKSDGKSFDSFTLFGLISRLEAKDIKTWTDLVVELGVELPDPSKNQSTQKVQQYAVRLKVSTHFHYLYALQCSTRRLRLLIL